VSDVDPAHVIHTRIWREEPERDNAFATKTAYCRGYDVFGELLGKARWVEMLFLLLRDELPGTAELNMLEALAVGLANPGPRDQSIHAAMAGGACGSTAAANLIAALSVGAGRCGGAHEVFDAMTAWAEYGTDLSRWERHADLCVPDAMEIWPANEHPPGFDPHGVSTATSVRLLLEKLASIANTPHLSWLVRHREDLERKMGLPLATTGVAAAAFADLGFTPREGEMLYLLLRLPGAAAHALEQKDYGYKRFPFYPIELEDDPAQKEAQ
jgi:citrate synthase